MPVAIQFKWIGFTGITVRRTINLLDLCSIVDDSGLGGAYGNYVDHKSGNNE